MNFDQNRKTGKQDFTTIDAANKLAHDIAKANDQTVYYYIREFEDGSEPELVFSFARPDREQYYEFSPHGSLNQ